MSNKDHSMALHEQFGHIYVLLDDGDRQALRGVGLTPSQYNLLRQLDPQTSLALTITQLSEILLCTRGNITRLVQRMEQQGLVQGNPDPADQRLVKVSLTAVGAARLAEARAVYRTAIQRRLGALDADTQATLHDLLHIIATRLTDDLARQSVPLALKAEDEVSV